MSENEMSGQSPGAPHGAIYFRVSSASQERLREAVSARSSADSDEGMTELQYQIECVIRYAAKAGYQVERTFDDVAEPAPESPDAA